MYNCRIVVVGAIAAGAAAAGHYLVYVGSVARSATAAATTTNAQH